MKHLSISVVSAAILAAASFGANAQQQQKPELAPSTNQPAAGEAGGQKADKAKPEQGKAGHDQPKAGDRAQMDEKPGQQGADKSGDTNKAEKPGETHKDSARSGKPESDPKSANQQQKQDGGDKAADQQKQGGGDKAADQQKQGGGDKSADQQKQGGSDRQASKEMKPEQRTIIKETIVREKIRPERITVQRRVGVAVPRTVVLYALPPTIIEVYPSYSRYKLIMVDDNTILIVDPETWMIVDVIEV
jgi:Protein of unknown function (DUF1236)